MFWLNPVDNPWLFSDVVIWYRTWVDITEKKTHPMWCNSYECFACYGILVIGKHEWIQIKIWHMLKFEFSTIDDHVCESTASLYEMSGIFLVKDLLRASGQYNWRLLLGKLPMQRMCFELCSLLPFEHISHHTLMERMSTDCKNC